jgi:beta-phosphoglucomutase-like phosphatase (HAD superfamily)
MQFALTLGEYKRSKPHPDPYLTALEKFGGKKEEAVVVEDSARGLKAAIAAGIECIIVRNEFTKSHDFTGATKILNSIQELNVFLQ